MDSMSFIIDYALIDPMTLCYKVDHVAGGVAFATYEDTNEDYFYLNIFSCGVTIPDFVVPQIEEAVRDYLFDK